MNSNADKLTAFDLVEGIHLGHAAAALHDLGVLNHLAKTPSTAEELAFEFKLDGGMLKGLLDFLDARTTLLSRSSGRYVVTRGYDVHARFVLGLYAGAFGESASQIRRVLRQPSLAPSLVDQGRHARTFAALSPGALGGLPGIIRQLEFNRLLDIGCGTASLLVHLAQEDASFKGWGLEPNRSMRKVARERIQTLGLAGRVKLIRRDSTKISDALSTKARSEIESISACQVMNAMFGKDNKTAEKWLWELRKTMPGRPLLVSDYYGQLGSRKPTARRETLLHDFAQLISGQGVPPATIDGWNEIYREAGCHLVHAIEDRNTSRFVHVVMLA